MAGYAPKLDKPWPFNDAITFKQPAPASLHAQCSMSRSVVRSVDSKFGACPHLPQITEQPTISCAALGARLVQLRPGLGKARAKQLALAACRFPDKQVRLYINETLDV